MEFSVVQISDKLKSDKIDEIILNDNYKDISQRNKNLRLTVHIFNLLIKKSTTKYNIPAEFLISHANINSYNHSQKRISEVMNDYIVDVQKNCTINDKPAIKKISYSKSSQMLYVEIFDEVLPLISKKTFVLSEKVFNNINDKGLPIFIQILANYDAGVVEFNRDDFYSYFTSMKRLQPKYVFTLQIEPFLQSIDSIIPDMKCEELRRNRKVVGYKLIWNSKKDIN